MNDGVNKEENDDQVLHESKAEEPDFEENEEGALMKKVKNMEDQAVYHIEKTQDEIQEQGYLQNFFECPYEYQEVIFMMVKGDQESLSKNELYLESQDLFNYYLQCIIEFSQQFDPTDTLMQIASDEQKRTWIHQAPNEPVTLQYILRDLWPKLGFLPIDPENPGVALVAEFMLNELILKNSESLDELDLTHLKELFSGDDEEGFEEGLEDDDMVDMMRGEGPDDEEDMDMEMMRRVAAGAGGPEMAYDDDQMDSNEAVQAMEALHRQQQQIQKAAQNEEEDDYSDIESPDTKDKSNPKITSNSTKQEGLGQEVSKPAAKVGKDSEEEDNYSSEKSSDDDDMRFMDINDLKERQEKAEKKKDKKKDLDKSAKQQQAAQNADGDDENYEEDDFI